MKLKETVKLLKDDKTWVEVPGMVIPFKIDKTSINLILHESIQPWTPHMLDVSDELTGCWCATTNKNVFVATKKDAEQAMAEMLSNRGVKNFLSQRKKRQQENLTR